MTNLTSPILDKFNITKTPVVEFTADQFKDNWIEIPIPRKMMFQMTKYRLENGMRDTPEINVKSPTGQIKTFRNPYTFPGGVDYRCSDLRLRLKN